MKRLIVLLCILFLFPLSLNAANVYTSKDTAKNVVKSLKTEPDNWFHDAYKLYYFKDKERSKIVPKNQWDTQADCVIWIANGAFAIKIEHPKRVIFDEKTQNIIWDIYEKWANGHFSTTFGHLDETFGHVNEPKMMKEDEMAKETNSNKSFIPLTTEMKKKSEANDFYSSIPKWFLKVAAIFSAITILALIGSVFMKRRKVEA